jgi:SpoVK/Ycf46/Vps4 family AAA+-type ATPase
MIPEFRDDGYLPVGLHLTTEAEVASRFGSSNPIRRGLAATLRRWIELAHDVGAARLMIGGSFVTAKDSPNDIDVVLLLPEDFRRQVEDEDPSALELDRMFETHRPREMLPADDEVDLEDWQEFFSTIPGVDRRRGMVEIAL